LLLNFTLTLPFCDQNAGYMALFIIPCEPLYLRMGDAGSPWLITCMVLNSFIRIDPVK